MAASANVSRRFEPDGLIAVNLPMKIVDTPETRLKNLRLDGMQIECPFCNVTFELEEADRPKITLLTTGFRAQIPCPNCSENVSPELRSLEKRQVRAK